MTTTLFRKIAFAAAVAGFTAAGAGAAAAVPANVDPFGPRVPYIPPTKTPSTNPGTMPGTRTAPARPRSAAPRYRSVGHYLRGAWDGRLQNGRYVRLKFNGNGRFAIISRAQRIAFVGYYRVNRYQIQLVIVGKCDANGCTRLQQTRRLNFKVQPRNRNAMVALGGLFQRRA